MNHLGACNIASGIVYVLQISSQWKALLNGVYRFFRFSILAERGARTWRHGRHHLRVAIHRWQLEQEFIG